MSISVTADLSNILPSLKAINKNHSAFFFPYKYLKCNTNNYAEREAWNLHQNHLNILLAAQKKKKQRKNRPAVPPSIQPVVAHKNSLTEMYVYLNHFSLIASSTFETQVANTINLFITKTDGKKFQPNKCEWNAVATTITTAKKRQLQSFNSSILTKWFCAYNATLCCDHFIFRIRRFIGDWSRKGPKPTQSP